jgi:amino acid permease
MAIWKRKNNAAEPVVDERGKDEEYSPERGQHQAYDEAPPLDHERPTELHRGLKARHITMIAIGGAIGTGAQEAIAQVSNEIRD